MMGSTVVALAAMGLTVIASRPANVERIGEHQVVKARGGRPTVVVARRSGPQAAIRIQFPVGAVDDGMSSGITRLALHSLLSANHRGSYATLLEQLFRTNARVSIETGPARCAFILEAPASEFSSLARALMKRVFAPQINRNRFSDARQRLFHEANRFDNDSFTMLFSRATLAERGLSRNPRGEREALRGLRIDEVRDHIAKYLRPANATVVLAGNFDPRLKDTALRYSGGRRRAPLSRPRIDPGLFKLRSRISAHLVGLPVSLATAQRAAVMRLAAGILNDRVFVDFRKMGIVSGASALPLRRAWLDFVLVIVPTPKDTQQAIETEILKRIQWLSNPKRMNERIFERYRDIVLHDLNRRDRSPVLLADELAMAGSRVPWFGPNVVRALLELDAETFQREVGRWAQPDSAVYVLLAPREQGRRERR